MLTCTVIFMQNLCVASAAADMVCCVQQEQQASIWGMWYNIENSCKSGLIDAADALLGEMFAFLRASAWYQVRHSLHSE